LQPSIYSENRGLSTLEKGVFTLNVSTSKLKSDTVLCSGGKGEVSVDACLACARAMEQTCGYDYALVNILLHDKQRVGIHVTDITGCLRKAWYEKTQTQPEYLHSRAYILIGNAMHEYLESHGAEGDAERTIEACGLVGTMDVYRDRKILDFKSTRWLTPSKLPYGSHAMQVNIYAEMMRKSGFPVDELWLQYIDMSGPTKCKVCKAPFEPELGTGYLSCPRCGKEYSAAHTGAELVRIEMYPREEVQSYINERRDTLLNSLETMEAPAQEASFLCSYCSFKQVCNPRE
jgi:CRISPR/Cas system-associated exonuclease Cas4 (RecB family)